MEEIEKMNNGRSINWISHLERMEEDRMPKIIHSSTGREEQKRKAQERMERGSRKRSSSAGIEEMGIGGWR